LVVLDLVRHSFEEARELYADVWLGFAQVEMINLLRQAGFELTDMAVVHRELEAPHLETLMVVADKPDLTPTSEVVS
jgi:ArsR family transcriptional regulator